MHYLLLELRLNILDKIVDHFVIVEGNKTWQNNPKELKFDIKKFHTIVLDNGNPPLFILEELIDDWIEASA